MANIHTHSSASLSQLGSASGLQRWLIWLAILAIVTGVIAYAFFLSQEIDGLINIAMYGVISTLGLGLIVKGFFDVRFLHRETQLASEQIRVLEVVDNFDDFLARTEPSIFRKHIDNLHTIAKAHGDISQDNLIEFLHTRLLANNKVVELFSSILITLGLIGTILGLILMMDDLSAVMRTATLDESFMRILADESGPLSGLGVAFVTTLLGAIFGGVVLRVLTNVVESNIMDYTAHIAELTEVYVLPHMRATSQQSPPADTVTGRPACPA